MCHGHRPISTVNVLSLYCKEKQVARSDGKANYAPKSFVKKIVNGVIATEGANRDEMVVATGLYGERGFMLYPYTSTADPSAKVGFSLLGRGANPAHTNLCREDAVDIVTLLVDKYDMNVSVTRTTVVTVN